MNFAVFLRLTVGLVVVGVIGGGFYACRAFSRFGVTMTDSYAAWHTGSYLGQYLAEHDGAWPSGWDGLGGERIKRLEQNFPDVRDRVRVRWDVDAGELASARSIDQPPFPMVWLDSGGPTGPTEENDANRIILETLNWLREQRHSSSEEASESD